jgi:cardiolipin synthase A/B
VSATGAGLEVRDPDGPGAGGVRRVGVDGDPAELPLSRRALQRAVGSPVVEGNRVALQFEGPVAFDAWIEAIGQAERFVHFENYILRDDPVGRRFREALVERARAGVEVRVLHDWMGCWATPRRYWKPFREAGIEVRAFNRPSLRDPFGILQRDHRKLVAVDGRVAFLGGFCIGQEWAGTEHAPPWRDTGVEIRGPGAAWAARTFERIWAETGDEVPEALQADPAEVGAEGDVPVWLIEGVPWRTRVYRVTQLMAAMARHHIWITDPYFVAPRAVRESLAEAARDGVDVRILVPAHNNWPWVGSLSRSGYRFLLEAGVRIFEWEGPMIHAKTAVVDGAWSRVGSTNLNSASLLGNWELDAGVHDVDFARQVQGLFLADLASAVEIRLPGSAGARGDVGHREAKGEAELPDESPLSTRLRQWGRGAPGAQNLTLADLVRAGSSLGDAIAGSRVLGREDRAVLVTLTVALLTGAVLLALFPRPLAWFLALILGWGGSVLAVRGLVQRSRARRELRRRRREVEAADAAEAAPGPPHPSHPETGTP